MANRVLLNSAGLKVSQAGANVQTATPAQLLFNSDWNALSVVQQGSFTINGWTGTNVHHRYHTRTIKFTKTHSTPPLMLIYLVYQGANIPVCMGSGGLWGAHRGGAVGYDVAMVSFVASTTALTVHAFYDKQQTPSLAVPNLTFRYFIFDFGA